MNVLGLLVGLFAIPAWMLREAHGLRYRSVRASAIFWGVVIGHVLGMVLMAYAAMAPAIYWGEASTLRTFLVFWSLVVGPVAGGVLGAVRSVRRA